MHPGRCLRTYDLRRLRRKQIIQRVPGSYRYQLTPTGRAVAVLLTKASGRILGPGPAASTPACPPTSPGAARSRSRGSSSLPSSTCSSAVGWPQREMLKLDLTGNFTHDKRS